MYVDRNNWPILNIPGKYIGLITDKSAFWEFEKACSQDEFIFYSDGLYMDNWNRYGEYPEKRLKAN